MEVPPLAAIWLTALGLMALAIVWMLGIIAMRVAADERRRRRREDRRRVEAALIQVMQGRADAALALAPYQRRGRLMAEAVLDFMSVVRGNDREVVVRALETMGVAEALRRRLRRGSEAGRLLAAEALSAFPGPETQAALRCMARGAPQARLTALEALARAGGQVGVRELLDEVVDGDLRASGRFAEFLRAQVEQDPAGGAEALDRSDLSPPLRILLLDALGASGEYGVIGVLSKAAGDADPSVRAAAVRALGRLKHPAGEPAIAAALADPDPAVRAAGADAAGGAGLRRLAGPLAERLSDEAWRVRFQAAAALGALGPPGVERLREAAARPDFRGHRAAALTLAELGA